MVTNQLQSPLLVILTSVDGLFDGDPSGGQSKLIPLVESWDDSLIDLAVGHKSSRGTGGMQSKLKAVRTATAVGENVIIANGKHPHVLDAILAGEEVGTLFLAKGQTVPAWKRWIGYTVPPKGRFVLDDGACQAIRQAGRSLLSIGITAVEGNFGQGDLVSLTDSAGLEIARGLSNYDSRDAKTIAGKRTEEIIEIFGDLPYAEVIHRDNLVVTV